MVWGGYHALLLSTHRLFEKSWARLPGAARVALTFVLAVFGWVIFRAESLGKAAAWLTSMLTWRPGDGPSALLWGCILVAAAISFGLRNTFEIEHRWRPLPAAGLTALFSLSLLVMYVGRQTPFLYFQF